MQVTKLQSQRKSLSTPEEPYALDILIITIQVRKDALDQSETGLQFAVTPVKTERIMKCPNKHPAEPPRWTGVARGGVLFPTNPDPMGSRRPRSDLTLPPSLGVTASWLMILLTDSLCVRPPGHFGVPAARHSPAGPGSLPGLPEAQQLRGPDQSPGVAADSQHALSHPCT